MGTMEASEYRGRILIGKPGLDGHDRGAKFVARALRDDGFEVIYTGIRRTPEEIAHAAVQEDVDVIGLSLLSGAHNELFPAVIAALRAAGGDDIPVIGGGVIPKEDFPFLERHGVRAIFTPGTPLTDLLSTFRTVASEHRERKSVYP